MPQVVKCPKCGASVRIEDHEVSVTCPYCDGFIQTNDDMQEVHRLISERRMIDAIKRYRELTGLGLKEAKDAVTEMFHGGVPPEYPLRASMATPNEDLEVRVRALLQQRNKIEAVKVVREATNWGLKESKDYVDNIERQFKT